MIDKIVLEEKNGITQIAGFKNGVFAEFILFDESKANEGNIYLGKIVKRIQTANGKEGYFVNIGTEKDAFINAEEGGLEDLKASEGQDVVVQVIQEARAEKGARLARFLQIGGACLVYSPYGSEISVSTKIKSEDKRDVLADIVNSNTDAGGWIVRTFAEKSDNKDIVDEIKYLQQLFDNILIKAKTSKAPCLLWAKNDFLRDILCRNIDSLQSIIVNSRMIEENLSDSFNVKYCTKPFIEEGIDELIVEAMQKTIKLKCGGRVIIEETKALVAIDVDSGEGVSQGGVGRLNQEAAEEIARQIILRNLSGKIVIDFAGIAEFRFLKNAIDILVNGLKEDVLRARVLGLTKAGNVEIVRSRRRPTLSDLFSEECHTCDGTGRVEK